MDRMTEIHGQLELAFTEGLHEGGENYQEGGQKNTAQEGGVKYAFAGKSANTANMTHLEQAQKMVEDGADPEEVRLKTGWHKGKDGK